MKTSIHELQSTFKQYVMAT